MSWLRRTFEPQPIEQWSSDEERAAFRRERKRLSENHYNRANSLAAWLLATLVAVNGGAVAIDGVGRAYGLPFVVGIVAAILSGFASWQEAQDRMGLHYIESLDPANRTKQADRRESLWAWRGPALRIAAKVLNWASLGAFIAGCVLAAQRPATGGGGRKVEGQSAGDRPPINRDR